MFQAPGSYIGFYQETVLQFGFLSAFGQSMPLVAIINLGTVTLEVLARWKSMNGYARRIKADGGTGIGVWLDIVEMLTFIAIPCNACIIYFVGDQSATGTGESKLVTWLSDLDPDLWTPVNILLLIVAIERGILILKFLLNAFIPDVPHHIKKELKKLPLHKKYAKKYIKFLGTQPFSQRTGTYESWIEKETEKYDNEDKAQQDKDSNDAPKNIEIEKKAFCSFVHFVQEANLKTLE